MINYPYDEKHFMVSMEEAKDWAWNMWLFGWAVGLAAGLLLGYLYYNYGSAFFSS